MQARQDSTLRNQRKGQLIHQYSKVTAYPVVFLFRNKSPTFGDELTLAVSREYQLPVEFLEDLMSLVFRGMSTTIPILIRVPSARKWSVGLTRRILQREQSKI